MNKDTQNALMLLFVLVVIWGIYYCQSQSNFKEGLNNELWADQIQTGPISDGIGHGMVDSGQNFGGNSLGQLNTILHGGQGY